MWPTILTPLSSSPKTYTERMLKITTTSEPGTSGSQRFRASTKIRLNTPTRRSSTLVSGRCLITPHNCSKKLPGVFSTPSSFGTWPMMIVKARPTMKPLSTGSEIKDATNPNRSSPASTPATPVQIASAVLSAT